MCCRVERKNKIEGKIGFDSGWGQEVMKAKYLRRQGVGRRRG